MQFPLYINLNRDVSPAVITGSFLSLKKLADLWIHFIIFSSLLLFLKDTFTSQTKDHCGIQVVLSKAGTPGGAESVENGSTDIVWREASGWKDALLPYQTQVHPCFLQMLEFSWRSHAITCAVSKLPLK